MKLIHLSDLHIGRRLENLSFLEDQAFILTRILQIVDTVQPDAVMICGDVYDKSTPSGEAVTLFDDFLCRLAKRNVPILIISGNHDSPERLAFGNRLFEHNGIYISSVYQGKTESVTLTDSHGQVVFWLLPFIKPINARRFFSDATIESYTDALDAVIREMPVDPTQRNVLLTHQFVTGANTCDSEQISVGGSDNVDARVFDVFDYVALGHIHGQQNIGSANRIRYCGSPLKYSFSEEHHHKSVTVVHLEEKGQLQVELIPLAPKRELRSIRGNFQQLTDKAFYENGNTDDYIHAILTDEEDVPEAMGKLRLIYPNILKLSYDNTRTRTDNIIDSARDVEEKTPLQLFEELYIKQNNQPMSPAQRAFSQALMESIWEGRK